MGRIKPAVNQVECHPYLNQSELVEHCKKRGVVGEATEAFKIRCTFLKGHPPTQIAKSRLAYFHVVSPNATKYTT